MTTAAAAALLAVEHGADMAACKAREAVLEAALEKALRRGRQPVHQQAEPRKGDDWSVAAVRMLQAQLRQATDEVVNLRKEAQTAAEAVQHNRATYEADEALLKKQLLCLVKFVSTCNDASDSNGASATTALHVAVKEGLTDLAEMLLAHGAAIEAVDKAGQTPLVLAAGQGQKEMVKLLLCSDAETNPVQEDARCCWTALHAAISRGHDGVVAMLLSHGADFDAVSEVGTPLMIAAEKGNADIVDMLLARSASVNGPYDRPQLLTPLCTAARYGHVNVMKLLLQAGADIDLADQGGCTPLYWATVCRRREAFKLLLARGASSAIATQHGSTPLSVAMNAGFSDFVTLLLACAP